MRHEKRPSVQLAGTLSLWGCDADVAALRRDQLCHSFRETIAINFFLIDDFDRPNDQ